jgi:hypothetical protein
VRRGRLRACGAREGGRDEGGLVSSVAGTRVWLKIAFRQLCVTLCGRLGPDEGGVVGYAD